MLSLVAGLLLSPWYFENEITMILLGCQQELLESSFLHGPFHLQTSHGIVRRVPVSLGSSLTSSSAPVKENSLLLKVSSFGVRPIYIVSVF